MVRCGLVVMMGIMGRPNAFFLSPLRQCVSGRRRVAVRTASASQMQAPSCILSPATLIALHANMQHRNCA